MNKKINLPIGVGGISFGKEERQYFKKILKTTRLSYGTFMKNFENRFARLHNCRYAVMSNSGTSSLQTAVAALKEVYRWKDGDEILVPAITFIATSNVVLQNRLKPVFIDVDPKTYNLDPTQIEKHLTPRSRAIIPVHLFGLPCEMDPILELARKKALRVIEDSCETMFVKYKGKSVGSFGDIGCFSTYIAHLLVTGVGGLATTNSPRLSVLMRSLISHGRDKIYLSIDDDNVNSSSKLRRIVQRRFRFVRMGYSYRATEMEAALGLAQLKNWKENILKRQFNAQYLIQGLKPFEEWLQLPTCPSYSQHSFMMFPLVLKGKEPKKNDLVFFLESHGIETRDMLPLINQPFYRKLFGNLEPQYPIARWINHNGFYIGCHPWLKKHELDYVLKIFHTFFKTK